MLILIGFASLIVLSYVIPKLLEWMAQDKHNDNYDRKKGGK